MSKKTVVVGDYFLMGNDILIVVSIETITGKKFINCIQANEFGFEKVGWLREALFTESSYGYPKVEKIDPRVRNILSMAKESIEDNYEKQKKLQKIFE